jgi:putative ABC transport system ATP-binding protein
MMAAVIKSDIKNVIEASGVTKTFGSGANVVHALRGINLTVPSGELLMLVGPSGCGKTTLISVLAGILDQSAGDVRVLGHDLKALGNDGRTKFRGKHLGFVFQAFNLLPALTAQENAAIPLMILGAARATALKKAGEMLTRVGLGERLQARPNQLSGGQQQRVAIARALVHDPQLIVCDEPTSALDHETGQNVMTMLKAVALQEGRALIVVTHDSRIFSFADRIARMDDGRIVDFSQPSSQASAGNFSAKDHHA